MTILKRDVYDAAERKFHFYREQDVEPVLDANKERRDTTQRGDFRHRWNLPVVMVNKFYDEYCGGVLQPMNSEFWHWVDRKIMGDPDFAYLRSSSISNFRVGYK